MRLLAVLLLLSSATALAAPPEGRKEGPPPAAVVLETVIRQQAQPTMRLVALAIPLRESRLASRVAGLVAQVHVEPGDRVVAGQALITLDTTETEAEEKIRAAQVEEARARLEQAEGELARDRQLKGDELVSRQRLLERTSEAKAARAAIAQAEAARDLASRQRQWSLVAAPFDGVVVERKLHVGEWVNRGDMVARVVDPDHLELQVMVPPDVTPHLIPGASVPVTLPASGKVSETRATLRAVVERSDPASRNQPAYFTLPEGTGIAPGEEATVEIPAGPQGEVLLVPKDAVQLSLGQATVQVADGENFRTTPIVVGFSFGPYFQVKEGLREGVRVVVRGNERLRPGQKLAPDGGKGKTP